MAPAPWRWCAALIAFAAGAAIVFTLVAVERSVVGPGLAAQLALQDARAADVETDRTTTVSSRPRRPTPIPRDALAAARPAADATPAVAARAVATPAATATLAVAPPAANAALAVVATQAPGPEATRTTIPHTLVFMHRVDFLAPGGEGAGHEWDLLRENVRGTARLYAEHWGERLCASGAAPGAGASPCTAVRFFTDTGCREAVRRAEPRLAAHFDRERQGKYRADICRVAVLLLEGGYYFDADIRAVAPVDLESRPVAFATVRDPGGPRGGFFQAFLASRAGHPVLAAALDAMLRYYDRGAASLRGGQWMGPTTLRAAYDAVPAARRGEVLLLQETQLEDHRRRFPSAERPKPQKGEGCCCNFVVYDPSDGGPKRVHFFSRIVGAGEFCQAPRMR